MGTSNLSPGHITYFKSPASLRAWFRAHASEAGELWVGYYKKNSGERSITWPESVQEALCVGWIDGIRKSVDDRRYTIRFTPRRVGSSWSAVNIRFARALIREKRMQPAGQRAFTVRRVEKSGVSSDEQTEEKFEEAYGRIFRKNAKAWKAFQARPAWYRRTAGRWVMSARKEETRHRRLEQLIVDSQAGRTIAPLTRK